MGEWRNMYKVLLRMPEGKRPLGRPKHRWEVGIKMDFWLIVWDNVERIHLTESRDRWRAIVNTAIVKLPALTQRC
jgi:hypothetical protein